MRKLERTGGASVATRAVSWKAPSVEVDAPELSIVLPCLNEARTIGTCIGKARAAIEEHGLRAEIIVADNGSTDGSEEIASRAGARVVHAAAKGYGAALMAGIDAARGEFVIMGDADDSYDFGAIYPFVETLRAGWDLAMGCRLPSGGGTITPGAMPWKHRWLGNPALSGLGRLFFRSSVTDFHCGLRGFRREAYLALDLRTTGMEFASEMIVKATLHGLRITEIPITLHKDGRDRRPHLRSWRDGWRHLRFMLLYSPAWLFLIPGGALLLVGSVVSAILVAGAVHVAGIGFDTSTLLVSAMTVILGYQVIVFGIISKVFAISEGLRPPDPLLDRMYRKVNLEVGIAAGVVLVVAGFASLLGALLYWRSHGFGPLDYSVSQRIIIPGVTAIVLGLQTVFSSFLLSVFGLARK
jgi:glycosyltransferase involved in cell wall biosynthesis